MVNPVVYMSRSLTISAGHRLNSFKLSEEENKQVYGKCNNLNGHGHNYEVVVTIRGRVNLETGVTITTSELQRHMQECIYDTLDHKHLDRDIPYFKEHPSTSENIAIYIWDNLFPRLKDILFEVKVISTAKNAAIYRGEEELI